MNFASMLSCPSLEMADPQIVRVALSEVRLGIVCPMANEGLDAPRFVEAVLERCGGFREVQFFAILDRATKDNSLELLQELAARERRLTVVWAPENRSVVDAYIRGYREALAAGLV